MRETPTCSWERCSNPVTYRLTSRAPLFQVEFCTEHTLKARKSIAGLHVETLSGRTVTSREEYALGLWAVQEGV